MCMRFYAAFVALRSMFTLCVFGLFACKGFAGITMSVLTQFAYFYIGVTGIGVFVLFAAISKGVAIKCMYMCFFSAY